MTGALFSVIDLCVDAQCPRGQLSTAAESGGLNSGAGSRATPRLMPATYVECHALI